MENRFSFRDLFISVLLVAVLVVVLLAMQQYDRQWERLKQIDTSLAEQTRTGQRLYSGQQELLAKAEDQQRRLERLEKMGVRVQGPGGPGPVETSATVPQTPAATQPVTLGPPVGQDIDPFKYIKQAQAMPGYQRGDLYVRAFTVLPPKLTPLVSGDAYAALIHEQFTLDSLAKRDYRNLQWVPSLAKYWQISLDGLRIEFEMRRGVTFSDGEPLTADDVVYSYQMSMNPDIECPRDKVYYNRIKTVEKINDHRVAFIFKEPYFKSFEIAAGMYILPKHFYSKFSPTEFNHSTGLLLGSGPYRLADPQNWRPEPGKPIELLRNDRYWGEPAVFDKIIFQIMENESARLTTFRNGQLDTFGATPEQHREMLKDQTLLAHTRHFEFSTPDAGYMFIAWNQQRGGKPTLFADRRVRLAMTLLTDRQRIVDDILSGYGAVPSGPFSALTAQADPTIKPWPYDSDQALKLLKEVGYELRDGILVGPDGQPFSFKFTYPSSGQTYQRIVLLIKDDFAKAGIQVIPEPTEWSVLLQRLDRRDFDVVSLGWGGVIEEDPRQIFHSASIPAPGDNFISYRNPELDHLIDLGRATVDDNARMKVWHQVHRILHEDQPYTFLMTQKSLSWIDNRFQNVRIFQLGSQPLEWWVPAGQRRWVGN